MITIRKLSTLKVNTRLRKYISILLEIENELRNKSSFDSIYINALLELIINDTKTSRRTQELAGEIPSIHNINSIRHDIMKTLGISPSDWDFTAPRDSVDRKRKILGINIFLDDIRSPFNLGSIFRSSECFGVEKIILSKDTTSPDHQRTKRTAMGCIDSIFWEYSSLDRIENPIFALELGGTNINEFRFPKTGTVIIGNEELGVSPKALEIADRSLGRVEIPLLGNKSSLNVSNALSILLYKWNEYLCK